MLKCFIKYTHINIKQQIKTNSKKNIFKNWNLKNSKRTVKKNFFLKIIIHHESIIVGYFLGSIVIQSSPLSTIKNDGVVEIENNKNK